MSLLDLLQVNLQVYLNHQNTSLPRSYDLTHPRNSLFFDYLCFTHHISYETSFVKNIFLCVNSIQGSLNLVILDRLLGSP